MLKITPRGEIEWQAHDVANGRLFLPESHDDSIDPMNLFELVDDDRNRHERLGTGLEGVVYNIAGHAVKAFIDPDVHDTVSTLRANVTLAEGLKRIAQPQNSSFEIAGANIRAAFVPHMQHEESLGYRAIWLMDKIDSPMTISRYFRKREGLFGKKVNKTYPLPTHHQRLATYQTALESYGLKITDIVNDEVDFKDINLMIAKLPAGRERGVLVKLDERPATHEDTKKVSFSDY